MMPKSHAYISILIAAVASFAIGLFIPHFVSGNDDDPIGYRTKAPQKNAQPATSPSPAPTSTFLPTRMTGTAQCFKSQSPCTVTVDILKSPSPSVCEIEDDNTSPPPPCPLAPCPPQASCLNFAGNYDVQHIRGKWFVWRIGDEAHTKENMFLQGIVIVQ
jgi:hypothetical protein